MTRQPPSKRPSPQAAEPEQPILSLLRSRLGVNEFASTPEVASACNCSADTVRRWIDYGHVEAIVIGGRNRRGFRVHVPSVVEFVRRRAELEN